MPGICGWTNRPRTSDGDFAAMLGQLSTLPGEEVVAKKIASSALGILDYNAADHYYDGDGILVAVDGTPYFNNTDLEKSAAELGIPRLLAKLYRSSPDALLQHLHGHFSIAILEPSTGDALLAVDRMGVHRLCYTTPDKVGLIFSTSLSAIMAQKDLSPTIDSQSLFMYLYHHCVPGPEGIYRNTWKLLPGQFCRYTAGHLTCSYYWQPSFKEERIPFNQLKENLHQHLDKAIARCVENSTHPGAFLSGGVDSSTIAGKLSSMHDTPVKTFSIGFSAPGYDEMGFARAAAHHFDTEPHEHYVTPTEVADAITKIAASYDEPFGNASAVPTYFCARLARDTGTDVILAGDGGDELFGGNTRYAQQKLFEPYLHIPHLLRQRVLEPLATRSQSHNHNMVLRKLISYIQQASQPLPSRLETYNFLNRVNHGEMFTPEFLTTVDTDKPLKATEVEYHRLDNLSTLNHILHLEWKQVLADNDLRKVTQMCTLAGITVRFPLLDDDLVEFSTQLPSNYKVRGLRLRYFFKKALADFLPDSVLTKSKHGFGLPFGVWLKDEPVLQELVNDSFSGLRTRGIINEKFLHHILDRHRVEHSAFYGEIIWVLMMLEMWLSAHDH